MLTLEFSKFFASEEEKKAVGNYLDKNQCILFFTKDDEIFGGPEESRLVFAKLKQPDDDVNKQWQDEAKFMAFNLFQSILGKNAQNIFSSKDLKKIKIIDRDEAINTLLKKKKGKK